MVSSMDGPGKQALADALPLGVRAHCDALRAAGGRVWVVGGAVRDALMGEPPRDWDLATDLEPDRVAECLGEVGTRDQHLGVITTAHASISTLRVESGYRDRRRPEEVAFVADLERDAARRDFTVNAIYWDPGSGELVDPTGGVEDLGHRLLRCIGAPRARLLEDPLRALRAVRFAARLDLELEAELRAALGRAAALLGFLPAERHYDELTAMWTGPGRGRALRLLVETGLAAPVLPEVAPMDGVAQPPEYHPEGDVLTHVCAVLEHCPAEDPVLSWAAVLHDVGKPPTFEVADRIRFSGHDQLSAEMAERALRRLRAPKAVREPVVEICRDHIRMAALPEMRPTTRERWLRDPNFAKHLAFHRADCLASHGDLRIHAQAEAWLEALPAVPPPPVVRGADVLALGVAPGPEVGRWLQRVEEHLDNEGHRDRERALAWLRDALDARD